VPFFGAALLETLPVQQSVVPELALAQTATRPIHWVATATAVAAVVAATSFVQPHDATAAQAHDQAHGVAKNAPRTTAPLTAPDPHSVTYPIQCGPAKVLVQKSATGDLDGDGRPETIAVVRCDAGSGTPPDGVYVVNAAAQAGAEPRVVATLVDPKDRETVTDFSVQDAAVTATLLGYSSPTVPSCCPDVKEKAQWRWEDGSFVRSTPAGTQAA
jgi:hypothetical protein